MVGDFFFFPDLHKYLLACKLPRRGVWIWNWVSLYWNFQSERIIL